MARDAGGGADLPQPFSPACPYHFDPFAMMATPAGFWDCAQAGPSTAVAYATTPTHYDGAVAMHRNPFGLHAAYNGGRILSYALLGALAGLLGMTLAGIERALAALQAALSELDAEIGGQVRLAQQGIGFGQIDLALRARPEIRSRGAKLHGPSGRSDRFILPPHRGIG